MTPTIDINEIRSLSEKALQSFGKDVPDTTKRDIQEGIKNYCDAVNQCYYIPSYLMGLTDLGSVFQNTSQEDDANTQPVKKVAQELWECLVRLDLLKLMDDDENAKEEAMDVERLTVDFKNKAEALQRLKQQERERTTLNAEGLDKWVQKLENKGK